MKKFKKLRTVAALMAALFMVQAIPFSAIAVGGEINGTIDHEAIIDQMHAPNEDLADNQVIQIYSITIGTLYKNNIGNAYFDNVELTPVN